MAYGQQDKQERVDQEAQQQTDQGAHDYPSDATQLIKPKPNVGGQVGENGRSQAHRVEPDVAQDMAALSREFRNHEGHSGAEHSRPQRGPHPQTSV